MDSKKFKLYKYFNIDGEIDAGDYGITRLDIIRNILVTNSIYVPSLHQLNDPFEEQLSSSGGILSTSEEQSGVLSFTTSHKNNLMWSHYSNTHSGICLVFNVDLEKAKKSGLHKVVYIDSMSEIDFFESPLIVKSKEWSYENEYRYIFKDSMFYSNLDDLGLSVEGLLFGAKICNSVASTIEEWLCALDLKFSYGELGENFESRFNLYRSHEDKIRASIALKKHVEDELTDYNDPEYIKHLEENAALMQQYYKSLYEADEGNIELQDHQIKRTRLRKKWDM